MESDETLESMNPVKTLTRGHKKKARTRQALIEAAIQIYAKKGVAGLLLNELAEEAGVSNGTVYNYFKTREDVLHAVGIELADQFSERITDISQDIKDGAERVAVGVRMFIRQGRSDPTWAGAVVSIFQNDQGVRSIVASNLQKDLQLGLSQGQFRIRNLIIAMGMVASTTIGAIAAILDGLDQPDYDVVATEMLLLALGVSQDKAGEISTRALPEPKLETAPVEKVKRKRGRPPKSK